LDMRIWMKNEMTEETNHVTALDAAGASFSLSGRRCRRASEFGR